MSSEIEKIRACLYPALGGNYTQEQEDKAVAELASLLTEARLSENQRYLDMINNFKPEPGQLTAESFGSAGAGIVEASWKRTFENRIATLNTGTEVGDE